MVDKKTIELIKNYEGCYLKSYKCPSGVLTIGYGHTKGVKLNDVITLKKANELLNDDIREVEKQINKLNFKTSYYIYQSLVSFTFNCGIGNLKKLLKNRNTPQYLLVMKKYCKGGVRVLKGLERRRKSEFELALCYPKTVQKVGCYFEPITEIIQFVVGAKIDGHYGKETEQKVKKFQKKCGLKSDGVVGVLTWNMIKREMINIYDNTII